MSQIKASLNNTAIRPERILIFLVMFILLFGIISLSSASSIVAYNKFQDPYYYVKHQLPFLAIGLVSFFYFAKRDYRSLRKYAVGFLLISIGLLVLVFIPGLGQHYGKAQSWIEIFGISVQPSEFVKFSLLFYLAAWLESRKKNLEETKEGILPFLFILGIVAFLMMLQPDFGTLSIISAISLLAYYVGGGKLKHIIYVMIIGGVMLSALIGVKIYKSDSSYQLDRIRCAFNPEFDTKKACYQINQSLIAVGSGGFWGRGLGQSRQKFFYLPEVSGDSIFAIIAEEFGLVGSLILVFSYLYLFYLGIRIARGAPDDFGKILAVGIAGWIAVQAVINIGGITNVIPMTGVPLPLVSSGGSALFTALSALGVLVNIGSNSGIYSRVNNANREPRIQDRKAARTKNI